MAEVDGGRMEFGDAMSDTVWTGGFEYLAEAVEQQGTPADAD